MDVPTKFWSIEQLLEVLARVDEMRFNLRTLVDSELRLILMPLVSFVLAFGIALWLFGLPRFWEPYEPHTIIAIACAVVTCILESRRLKRTAASKQAASRPPRDNRYEPPRN